MVEETQLTGPDYKKIYSDLIIQNFPQRFEELHGFITGKSHLTNIDIIIFNKILFGTRENTSNGKLRVYTKRDIQNVLDTQKKLGLNNSQAAKYFNVSRNSITKWKKFELSNI